MSPGAASTIGDDRSVEELRRELAEAREQQAAAAEILRVISNSPMELQRVFAEIAASAARLCDAHDAAILQVAGDDILRVVAHHGPIPSADTLPLMRGYGVSRAVLERRTIHVADAQAETVEYPEGSDSARRLGFRTVLSVPLIRAGQAIGVINIRRTEVRPFSERQIDLLKTFADQAVIAIENTRLIEEVQARTREATDRSTELARALEQQTATGEVLSIISRSPTDVQPVFDTIARSAAELCKAKLCNVLRLDGQLLHVVASHFPEFPEGQNANANQPSIPPGRGSAAARAVASRTAVMIPNVDQDPDYEMANIARFSNVRSIMAVPMLKDACPIGAIAVGRSETGYYPEQLMELLRTFAEQAIIAIENARLFEEVQARTKELQDSLEIQTAMSEVLGVISRTPTELQPILNVIVSTAVRLCGATHGHVRILRDDGAYHIAAHQIEDPNLLALMLENPFRPGMESVSGRAALEGRTVHVADVTADPLVSGFQRQISDKVRTALAVPLRRKGDVVGLISVFHNRMHPFTKQQIELVETFADQAVIAINNVGLFEEVQARTNELTESLEYQTATSDVLGVISRSPTNVQPVFDTIAQAAAQLCKAQFCHVFRFDGQLIHFAASHGQPQASIDNMRRIYPIPPGRVSAAARSILTGTVEEIPDIHADPEYQHGHTANYRSIVAVPMLKDSRPVGAICMARTGTGAFPRRQVELLQTFADQAVIAIENTRLFEAEQARTKEVEAKSAELRESLEYQTATADVLNVISRSPNELQPVLNAIVATAGRLCEADYAHCRLERDGRYHVVARHALNPDEVESVPGMPVAADRSSVSGKVVSECRTIHVPDILADPEDTYAVKAGVPARTILGVPLIRNGKAIGVIVLFRRTVRPFTQRQIDLVTTFAHQAVIAIENTRLFEEVQARNSELQVALEQQTATSELLKVIGRSTFDLAPVFKTLAENAVRLCEAERAMVLRYDGEHLRLVAGHNVSPELRTYVEEHPIAPGRHTVGARAALERRTIHIHDVKADYEITYGATEVDPLRTMVAVPMLRADELLGVIAIYRQEVRPFSTSQVALVETFADQAGIAIENARLLEELQSRNRDLTALGEVGRAVSSTLDLKAVLKTIVDRAVELSGTDAGAIFYFREDIGKFQLGESTGLNEEVIARFRKLDIATGQTGLGEAIANRKPLQISDITKRASNALRDAAIEAGLRAALIVPLLSAETSLGALVLQRRQPGEFAPGAITLMQSFADQSAIALENARLFEEIAHKSRELEIASQHKSQFVANMSHELRTPLAAILGYAELIQEGFYGPLSDKALESLTRIRSNGKHLLGLINTVLDIAKIESGQFTLNMAEYAIESVVETVRSATESLAQNKKLVLKTDVAKSLPIGLGDEQRLTQVLLNIVGNAIKFTDAGEVRVTAKAVNGHFAVSVTDTGPGIPEEHRSRIFDQFHQVDSSNTKAKGGTGLGLAIAKQIVEMHGGRIWVESTLGKGSTFQMELPTRAQFRKLVP